MKYTKGETFFVGRSRAETKAMADLNNLTDDELRRKLMDAGLPVGPIVGKLLHSL